MENDDACAQQRPLGLAPSNEGKQNLTGPRRRPGDASPHMFANARQLTDNPGFSETAHLYTAFETNHEGHTSKPEPGNHWPDGVLQPSHPQNERVETGKEPGQTSEESDRLQLLNDASSNQIEATDPLQQMAERVRAATVTMLGGEALLGRLIRNEEDLLEALAMGFPGQVLRKLQDAGCPHAVLEQVIAPRRTLMRRRAAGQRLTSEESDAAWRLAHALTLAESVLNGLAAAINWLTRPKEGTGRAPIELLKTSVGAAYVERKLRQLDWGDVA